MMKVWITLLLLSSLTLTYAQGAKKSLLGKATAGSHTDTLHIVGAYHSDTVKVRVKLYMEDHSLNWTFGYVVLKSFVPVGQAPANVGRNVYTQKWEAIREDDIDDLKQYDWK